MLFKIYFVFMLSIGFLKYAQCSKRCNYSELQYPNRDLPFRQQKILYRLELKTLDKKLSIKKLDCQIFFNKTNAEKMDNMESTIKILSAQLNESEKAIESLQTSLKTLTSLAGEKCQSGVFGAHSVPQPKWPAVKVIKFSPPFSSTPSVVHGFTKFDSDQNTNIRAAIHVTNVSKTGFTLTLTKFGKTIQYGLGVRWMACL